MSETREPILLFATGRPPEPGELYWDSLGLNSRPSSSNPESTAYLNDPGYRRAPEGWTTEAVERVRALLHGNYAGTWPTDEVVRAAILGESEPEPEPWEIEAAREWGSQTTPIFPGSTEYVRALARHFARARAAEGRKP